MQCGNHTCLATYVKYVCRTFSYKPIKYFAYMSYISGLGGIYLAMTCKIFKLVKIWHMCENVGSIYACSTLAV